MKRRKQSLRDAQERNSFVLRYNALPYRVARDLENHPVARRLSFDDRVQAGFLGLLRACELFDFEKISTRTGVPVKPLSYLYCTVRNWIVTSAYKQSSTITVPYYAWDKGSPGIRYRRVGSNWEDGMLPSEEPCTGAEEDPVNLANREEELSSLREASELLTIREKHLVRLLASPLGLSEIARKIGVRSKEMVRVRKKRILWKLRSVLIKEPKRVTR